MLYKDKYGAVFNEEALDYMSPWEIVDRELHVFNESGVDDLDQLFVHIIKSKVM